MMEKAVTWAIQQGMEEVDPGVTTAALMGAALDSATFVAIGVPSKEAFVAGAVTGAALNIRKKLKGGKKE